MSNSITCPHCTFQNPKGSKFCEQCGRPLVGEQMLRGGQDRGLVNWVANKVNRVLDVTDDFLDAFSPQTPQKRTTPSPVGKSTASSTPRPTDNSQSSAGRITERVVSKEPGASISYFRILDATALSQSNYYKVIDTRCENCKHENSNHASLKCDRCQQPLRKYVLRESYVPGILREEARKKIIQLSENVTGVLKHNKMFYVGSRQYILLDGFPEPWFSLGMEGVLPVDDREKIFSWLDQIGGSLKQLHKSGLIYYNENKRTDWVEPILILKNQQAYIADISMVSMLEASSGRTVQKDILFLTKVLYALLTGRRQEFEQREGRSADVPAAFKEVIKRALDGGFTTVDAFLDALRTVPKEPEVVRSLRQLVGYGTDVGKSRDHNEDYVSKFSLGLEQIPGTPEVGLYIVADGMGGHQAGEKASESVIKDVVINRIQEQLQQLRAIPKLKRATIKLDDVLTPGEILREAILQANQVLLNARKAQSGRDRGTTITAALVVGNTCTIANVGDSRTYLLGEKGLQQITQDHSLVASLVASNMIKPSEVRSHPQRNQIYRTLGDKPKVEVDLFQKTLAPGNQLLLCSDGLWEMVLDDAIEKILRNARTPQSACDRLIEAANAAGGEDNISVIVVWLE